MTAARAQSFGYTRSFGWAVAVDADGKIVMTGSAKPPASSDDTLLVPLIGTEITTPVIEFYNTQLNHYFITADPNEAAAIDGGAAGPGWTRTGEAFKSGGPNRVCRFYGSPDINPATGTRRGPNSHVYTIDADECAAIRMDAGWRFESYDFNGWNVPAGGVCPAGTIAVKRAYNKRFAENDSNHRYTTSNAIYDQMTASGRAGPGRARCSARRCSAAFRGPARRSTVLRSKPYRPRIQTWRITLHRRGITRDCRAPNRIRQGVS